MREERSPTDKRVSDLARQLAALDATVENRGRLNPWQKRLVAGMVALLMIGLGIWLDSLAAQSDEVTRTSDRVAVLEETLRQPRFHAGDGLTAIECQRRALDAVLQLLIDHRSDVHGRELPVIERQVTNCLMTMSELARDLKRRKRSNGS